MNIQQYNSSGNDINNSNNKNNITGTFSLFSNVGPTFDPNAPSETNFLGNSKA